VRRTAAPAKPAPPPPPAEAAKVVVPLTVEVITGTTRAETKFKPEEAKP
jgi:hypothetical protein